MYSTVIVFDTWCVGENIILLIYCSMNTYQSVTLATVLISLCYITTQHFHINCFCKFNLKPLPYFYLKLLLTFLSNATAYSKWSILTETYVTEPIQEGYIVITMVKHAEYLSTSLWSEDG